MSTKLWPKVSLWYGSVVTRCASSTRHEASVLYNFYKRPIPFKCEPLSLTVRHSSPKLAPVATTFFWHWIFRCYSLAFSQFTVWILMFCEASLSMSAVSFPQTLLSFFEYKPAASEVALRSYYTPRGNMQMKLLHTTREYANEVITHHMGICKWVITHHVGICKWSYYTPCGNMQMKLLHTVGICKLSYFTPRGNMQMMRRI